MSRYYSRTGLNVSSVIVAAGVILLFLSVNLMTSLVSEKGLQFFMSYDCCSHLTWSHFTLVVQPLLAWRSCSRESPDIDMERRMKTELRFRLTHDWMN